MFRICLLSSLCAFSVGIALSESDLRFVIIAIGFTALALVDIYCLSGRPFTEDELPRINYQVVSEVHHNGHTTLMLLTKKGEILTCTSEGAEFTKFKLWGDRERLLVPVVRTR